MKNILLPPFMAFLLACSSHTPDAQKIIDQAIVVAGGEHFEDTDIEFMFREKEYGYKKTAAGEYEYVRLFEDTAGVIRDELTNTGFKRQVNGEMIHVADSMVRKYSNSINSVIYFALVPYGLNDPAVNKEYLAEVAIEDKLYHKIKVTFAQEGGGEDYQDIFIYWIGKEDHSVDYLAYVYETDGGGMRFRKAVKPRYVGNIKFVDYINYKPVGSTPLEKVDEAFVNGQLEELSRIELKKIQVNPF